MFKKMLVLSFFAAATVGLSDYHYRSYISTRLAKAVMSNTDLELTPEEEDKAICDGSGWITHGDGHRTECPGCKACNKKEDEAIVEENNGVMYHFGAEWCEPCRRMKRETWENKELKDFLTQSKLKLVFLDYDNAAHKEMFQRFSVTNMPTVILLKDENSNNSIMRTSGYISAQTMVKIIKERLNEQ